MNPIERCTNEPDEVAEPKRMTVNKNLTADETPNPEIKFVQPNNTKDVSFVRNMGNNIEAIAVKKRIELTQSKMDYVNAACTTSSKFYSIEFVPLQDIYYSIKELPILQNTIVYSQFDSSSLFLYLINDHFNIFISFQVLFKHIQFHYNSVAENPNVCEVVMEKIISLFKQIQTTICGITWFFIQKNGINTVYIEETIDDVVMSEAYPYLPDDQTLDEYIVNYFNSDENILFLSGKPGTGKTKLIRRVLQLFHEIYKDQPRAFYATDSDVLKRDDMFISFIENSRAMMIIEDMDLDLADRMSGNPVMYKLLATSDGLFNTKNKIIISTNLEEAKVDQALLRNGRCYDSLKTRPLTKNEANEMLAKLNSKTFLNPDAPSNLTLAEIYRFYKTGIYKADKTEYSKTKAGILP